MQRCFMRFGGDCDLVERYPAGDNERFGVPTRSGRLQQELLADRAHSVHVSAHHFDTVSLGVVRHTREQITSRDTLMETRRVMGSADPKRSAGAVVQHQSLAAIASQIKRGDETCRARSDDNRVPCAILHG